MEWPAHPPLEGGGGVSGRFSMGLTTIINIITYTQNIYNLRWQHHPNLSWNTNPNAPQPLQEKKLNLEEVMANLANVMPNSRMRLEQTSKIS